MIMIRKFSCAVLLLLSVNPGRAQTDTEFWFAAPELSEAVGNTFGSPPVFQNTDRPVYLNITAYGQPATVTVTQPAASGTGYMPPQVVNVAAHSSQRVNLTAWLDSLECKPPDRALKYGLKIVATAPVTVYYDIASFYSPENFPLKGKNALGTEFWIPGQNIAGNEPAYVPTAYNSFDIIATQNNTTVTITPAQAVTGHAAGVPYTVTLQEGQTCSATATGTAAGDHLVGSHITSDKPVAVTVKDDELISNTYFGGGCQDAIGDQVIPTHLLGTEYIAIQGQMGGQGDQLFITATQNGTTITQNAGGVLATINAGDTYRVPLSAGGATSTYIQTSRPVTVWQLTGIGCEAGGAVLPQISCSGSDSVTYTRSMAGQLYFNLLVRNGGQGDFLVNGAAGVITAGQFTAVPGTGGQWYAAQVPIPVGTYPQYTPVRVTNTSSLFHLGVLEGAAGSGSTYGYFSDFRGLRAHAGTKAPGGKLCTGDTIALLADTVAGASYRWSGPNGYSSSVQNPVIPNAAPAHTGVYTLTVEQTGCGSDTDTVHITVTAAPVVDLGPDVSLCADSVVLLSSGSYTSPAYLWNNSQTTPTLTARASGLYWLQVTENGCSGSDTISVTLNTALTVSLGSDTGICDRDAPLALSSPQPAGTQYLWSTGLTTPSINVTRTDTYWLEATLGDCKGSDTIVVKVIPTPSIHIGNDSFICEGQPANIGDVIPGATYLWSTGSTASSIAVSESGSYWLTADLEGCRVSDTVLITVTPVPAPDLGPDRDICPEQVILLDAHDAGGSCQWSTGDTTSSLAVNDPGTYWVKVRSAYGCAGRDTVTFSHYPLPVVSLGADTTVCEETPLLLQPFRANSDSLRWSDGSMGDVLTVTEGGVYIVSGINKCGETRDTVSVKQIFCDIWVPNAFTPNGDGVNDVFRVLGNVGRLENFRLRIFNRWGQLLFETSDRTKGWDGRQADEEALLGVYAYMMEYSLKGRTVLQKGNFTLLR